MEMELAVKTKIPQNIKISFYIAAIAAIATLCSGCSNRDDYEYTGSGNGYDRTADLEQENEALRQEADDANQRVEDANQRIEDAKSSAWDDYDSMGESLDDLEPVDDY